MPWLDDLDAIADLDDPDDDVNPTWFSAAAVAHNGVDPGEARRAAIRAANSHRQRADAEKLARKAREQSRRLAARPPRTRGQAARPPRAPRVPLARLHPDGLARLLDAIN